MLTRRHLLAMAALANRPRRLLLTWRGRTWLVNADGSGLRALEFDVPRQSSWQPGPVFRDGRRVILLSIEQGQGQSWKGEAVTHWWIHDLVTGALREIQIRDRPAPYFIPCCLLPGENELVAQGVAEGNPSDAGLYRVALDGSSVRPITPPNQGHHYCASLSPDGNRLAFHVAGPRPHGYRVFTCDLEGGHRTAIAAEAGHLYFGVHWSPDGEWLLYQDCHAATDPGHDWSDICIGRPSGGEHRVLTQGQSQWFAAAWGDPALHGSGSNVAQWTPQGRILYTRKLPGSQPAYRWSVSRPDQDHFNRDFQPGAARGGTGLCLLDPRDKSVAPLTRHKAGLWDWYALASPDGAQIAFSRATTGGYPGLWIMDSRGRHPRKIADGFVSRWIPQSL